MPDTNPSDRRRAASTGGRRLSTNETIERVAEFLNVSVRTARRRVAAGCFPGAFRTGGMIRIPWSDVTDYMRTQRLRDCQE